MKRFMQTVRRHLIQRSPLNRVVRKSGSALGTSAEPCVVCTCHPTGPHSVHVRWHGAPFVWCSLYPQQSL